jgi:DNA processing protein
MDRDELAGWLRLLLTPGLGRDGARRLLAVFGLPQDVFAHPTPRLAAIVGPRLAEALAHEPPGFTEALQRHLAWCAAAPAHHHILTLGDPAWPLELLATADPPLLLLVQGHPRVLRHALRVAIVGSRHPTPAGQDHAHRFARALGQAGACIVSGLARGIDAAAHLGALEAGAPTIAVVGTGPDRVYPHEHAALARRIVEAGGAIVSEYLLGTPPLPAHFPQRNRLIAGLAQGTLVVEAALRSGSLITARIAAEQGREVFALPGSIHAPQSRGCHALIRQGAKLVETADDILEELHPARPARAAQGGADTGKSGSEDGAGGEDDPLLRAMGYDALPFDELQARCGEPTERLQARLLALELAGRVARLPGGWWQRRGQG